MARPSSTTTRFRQWLVKKIEPFPDNGEAWCVDCKINSGKTQIIPVNSMRSHVMKHQTTDFVKMLGSRRKKAIV